MGNGCRWLARANPFDDGDHVRHLVRLCDKCHPTDFQRPSPGGALGIRAQKDDGTRRGARAFLKAGVYLEAVHVRHTNIEKDCIRPLLRCLLQSRWAIKRCVHFITRRPKPDGGQLRDCAIIIDDENFLTQGLSLPFPPRATSHLVADYSQRCCCSRCVS